MGRLVDGKWVEIDPPKADSRDGKFVRTDSAFRNWITPDGSSGPTGGDGFAAESGRYHLYVSLACPWAHRTLIFRALKGLIPRISVSVVSPEALDGGWSFDRGFAGATGDTLYDQPFLRDIYLKTEPDATTRVTVPVLWDKQREAIVSNESSEIIRMFNSAFNDLTGDLQDYYPVALRPEIDTVNSRIYSTVNNGVYKSGFARSQSAYDKAVSELFDTLDWIEERLSRQRYLVGDVLTEADWRLLPTLLRFDLVYYLHFKCNRRRLIDYPSLWAYTRELYQMPGIAETTNFEHIVRHYFFSHESINPFRIIPINPLVDWDEPHGRGQFTE